MAACRRDLRKQNNGALATSHAFIQGLPAHLAESTLGLSFPKAVHEHPMLAVTQDSVVTSDSELDDYTDAQYQLSLAATKASYTEAETKHALYNLLRVQAYVLRNYLSSKPIISPPPDSVFSVFKFKEDSAETRGKTKHDKAFVAEWGQKLTECLAALPAACKSPMTDSFKQQLRKTFHSLNNDQISETVLGLTVVGTACSGRDVDPQLPVHTFVVRELDMKEEQVKLGLSHQRFKADIRLCHLVCKHESRLK